jgi:hypothetical protein
MAGANNRAGSSRAAGGGGGTAVSDKPKSINALASVSQAAFERRYARASRDRMQTRRYIANADRPRWDQDANNRRLLQTNATQRGARNFYESLRTDRATGMPQSLQAGFANRERRTTGTTKKAGRKRSRLVNS